MKEMYDEYFERLRFIFSVFRFEYDNCDGGSVRFFICRSVKLPPCLKKETVVGSAPT